MYVLCLFCVRVCAFRIVVCVYLLAVFVVVVFEVCALLLVFSMWCNCVLCCVCFVCVVCLFVVFVSLHNVPCVFGCCFGFVSIFICVMFVLLCFGMRVWLFSCVC